MPSLTSRLNIRASRVNRIVPRTSPRLARPLSGRPLRLAPAVVWPAADGCAPSRGPAGDSVADSWRPSEETRR
jgi:hypothetical protein